MKRLFILFVSLIFVITLTSCECNNSKPCLCACCGKDLEVGDYLVEGYKVIKVCESTSEDMCSYELVDEDTNVVYLFTYFYHGDARSTSMTPIYNSDGSLRKYEGK